MVNEDQSKKKKKVGDFPGSPVVKTTLPLQGMWVQSLMGNLKAFMQLPGAEKKNFQKVRNNKT